MNISIINSTITGNTAREAGGFLAAALEILFESSTVTNNTGLCNLGSNACLSYPLPVALCFPGAAGGPGHVGIHTAMGGDVCVSSKRYVVIGVVYGAAGVAMVVAVLVACYEGPGRFIMSWLRHKLDAVYNVFEGGVAQAVSGTTAVGRTRVAGRRKNRGVLLVRNFFGFFTRWQLMTLLMHIAMVMFDIGTDVYALVTLLASANSLTSGLATWWCCLHPIS